VRQDTSGYFELISHLCVLQVILFAPTITEGGGFEQIVGLTCDWLLLGVWSMLYHKSDAGKRKYVIWGLFGAVRLRKPLYRAA
jgi:hypothetical protein